MKWFNRCRAYPDGKHRYFQVRWEAPPHLCLGSVCDHCTVRCECGREAIGDFSFPKAGAVA